MAPPAAERPVLHTRKVVDSLVRMLDQQAHVAEMVSAQASSLAALPAWEVQQPEQATADESVDESVLTMASELAERHRSMGEWLRGVAEEAAARREDVATRREQLQEQARRVNGAVGELASLALELHGAQREVASSLAARRAAVEEREPDGALVASEGRGAAWWWRRDDGDEDDGRRADIVYLNVGGHRFATTRSTLTAEESMLCTMFSGRYDSCAGGAAVAGKGGVFIDRDGTHFRHVLNYLRGGELQLGRDVTAHRALLEEADFYQLSGLQGQLRASLERIEVRGERLRRLSMDSTIERVQGSFDELIHKVYAEVEEQAARGKRVCSIGFLQEKKVRGSTFRSQASAFWDATITDARLHRLLSSISNQQVLCDRLADEGLKAHIKPLSVNTPAGDESSQWVSTTTLLLTVTIWEPTHHLLDSPLRDRSDPTSAGAASLGGVGPSRGSPRRAAGSSLQSWSTSTGEDVDPDSPLADVHRRTLSTGWAWTPADPA